MWTVWLSAALVAALFSPSWFLLRDRPVAFVLIEGAVFALTFYTVYQVYVNADH